MGTKKITLIFFMIVPMFFSLKAISAEDTDARAGNRSTHSQEYEEQVLGRVRWMTSLEEAQVLADAEDMPILILHQNVSDNGRSLEYGTTVLDHPLVVEAIESLFIPVAFFQGGSGMDETYADLLGDLAPSALEVWITDSDFNDVAPRLGESHTIHELLGAMIEAYGWRGKDVPEYVKILHTETVNPDALETAIFPVHCFWAGEVELGPSEGIVQTVPGRIDKQETVEVVFDRSVTSYEGLLEEALDVGLCENAYSLNDEQYRVASELVGTGKVKRAGKMFPDNKPKYYLSKSAYRHVPMTERQSIMVNADLFYERDPRNRLSPRQVQMHEFIERNKRRYWKNQIGATDLTENWVKLTDRIRRMSGGKVSIH